MLERAYAKLNLSLDVLGKSDDGYHDMRMVMQSIAFGDDIDVELTDGAFTIDPGQPYLPADGRNLAMKAAMLFLDGTGRGAHIRVTKRSPVCAGMGGGSSDAAAVLRALNRLTGAGMSEAALCAMAEGLGSDVPFCVAGGTQLAEGRGEKLRALPPLPDCAIVIVKPAFSISTPQLFTQIDARRSRMRPDTAGICAALEAGQLAEVSRRLYNVFEDVLPHQWAEVFTIKSALLSGGALGAAMTGTGSAVFGLFDNETAARRCHETLARRYAECWLTRPAARIDI